MQQWVKEARKIGGLIIEGTVGYYEYPGGRNQRQEKGFTLNYYDWVFNNPSGRIDRIYIGNFIDSSYIRKKVRILGTYNRDWGNELDHTVRVYIAPIKIKIMNNTAS